MSTKRLTSCLLFAYAAACGGSAEPITTAATPASGGSEAVAVDTQGPTGASPSAEVAVRTSTSEAWLPVVAHGAPIRRVVRDATGRYALARSNDGVVSFYDLETRAPRLVARVGGARGEGDLDLLAIAPDGRRAVAGTTSGAGQSALMLFDLPSGEIIDFVPRNQPLTAYWMDTDPNVESVFVLVRDFEASDEVYRLEVRDVDASLRCQSEGMPMDLPWNRRRGFVSRSGDMVVLAGADRTYVVDASTCEATELEPGSVPDTEADSSRFVAAPAAILVRAAGEPVLGSAEGAPASGASELPVVGVISFAERHSLVITTESSAIEWSAAGARVLRCGAGATRGVELDGRSLLITPRSLCDVAEDRALGDGAALAALADDARLAVVSSSGQGGRVQTLLVELPAFRVRARAGALRDFGVEPGEARAFFTGDAAFVAMETVEGIVVVETASGGRVRHRLPRAAALVGTDGERDTFVYRADGERYGSAMSVFDPRQPNAPARSVDSAAGYSVMTAFDVDCRDGRDVAFDPRTLESLQLGTCAPSARTFVPVGDDGAFALFYGSTVELRRAAGADSVLLRSIVTTPVDASAGDASVFAFALDARGQIYFAMSEPSVRVRRVGDARTSELSTPRSEAAPLASIALLLGAP